MVGHRKLTGSELRKLDSIKSRILHFLQTYKTAYLSDLNFTPLIVRNMAIQELEKERLIRVQRVGRATLVHLR